MFCLFKELFIRQTKKKKNKKKQKKEKKLILCQYIFQLLYRRGLKQFIVKSEKLIMVSKLVKN